MATSQHYIGYDNIVSISNIEATSEADGFPATNLANPATNLKWKTDGTGAQYVTVILTSFAEIDYIGIVGFVGASVELRGRRLGGVVHETIIPAWTPTVGRTIMKMFETSGMPWDRIILKITPISGVSTQISNLYVGKATQLPHNVYGGVSPLSLSRKVETVDGTSQSGQYLGSVTMRTSYSGSISLRNIPPAWYRSVFDPFVVAASGHTGQKRPFFYAWRLTDYPEEVAYCWLQGSPIPKNSGVRDFMDVSLKVEAIA